MRALLYRHVSFHLHVCFYAGSIVYCEICNSDLDDEYFATETAAVKNLHYTMKQRL